MVLVVLAVSAALTPLAAEDVNISASVNANKIGTDDVLIFTLTVKGIRNPQQPNLSVNHFRVVQKSSNREFRFTNGVSSYVTNFVYYLMAVKTGNVVIGPLSFQYDGKELKTEAFHIEVVKGSVAPPRQQQTGQRQRPRSIFDDDDFPSPFGRRERRQPIDVFLKGEVSKKHAVVGESIIYRVLLFSRNTVNSLNPLSNMTFPGFWQEWFPVPRSITPEHQSFEGKIYQVYEIRKAALFPSKGGKVEIPSLKFEFGLGADPFSGFFNQPQRIERSTKPIAIDVADAPPEAKGLPVGSFSFTVKPVKNTVDINDILTLKVKLHAAKGNIKTVPLPNFKSNGDYKIYPSKESRNYNYGTSSLAGVVEVEVPVSFKKNGSITFPSLDFKFYNPDLRQVKTLKSAPFTINVTGEKEKRETAITVGQTEIIKKGEDIDFIKKGDIYRQDNFFYKTGYFKLLLLLFFLLNGLYLLKIVVVDRFLMNNPLLNRKRILNNAITRLNGVTDYGEISPILEDYLKEKAGLGLSEINKQSIETLLEKAKVVDSDIKVFVKIKSNSELSRFAPKGQGGSANEKETLKHDLKQLIGILKRNDGRIK